MNFKFGFVEVLATHVTDFQIFLADRLRKLPTRSTHNHDDRTCTSSCSINTAAKMGNAQSSHKVSAQDKWVES